MTESPSDVGFGFGRHWRGDFLGHVRTPPRMAHSGPPCRVVRATCAIVFARNAAAAESIPVGSDGVRTRLSLRDQTLCKEGLQQGWEVRRFLHRNPPHLSSMRFPAAPISSGVLVRYQ